MAEIIQINQIPISVPSFTDNDVFECEIEVSPGVFATRKTTYGFLKSSILADVTPPDTGSFLDTNLVADKITISHNLTTLTPSVDLYDPDGYEVAKNNYTNRRVTIEQIELEIYEPKVGQYEYKITKE